AVALALVEVVSDRAHEAVPVLRHALQRPAEDPVGLALAIDVGREQGRDPVPGTQQRGQALLVDRLAEAQVAAAAPGSDRDVARIHRENVTTYAPADGPTWGVAEASVG